MSDPEQTARTQFRKLERELGLDPYPFGLAGGDDGDITYPSEREQRRRGRRRQAEVEWGETRDLVFRSMAAIRATGRERQMAAVAFASFAVLCVLYLSRVLSLLPGSFGAWPFLAWVLGFSFAIFFLGQVAERELLRELQRRQLRETMRPRLLRAGWDFQDE